jgi:hypothetical protein
VPHRNSIIDGNRIELSGNTPNSFNLPHDQLANIFQMNMTGNELCKRIHDCDYWFAKVALLHSGGAPEAARPSHVSSMCGRS